MAYIEIKNIKSTSHHDKNKPKTHRVISWKKSMLKLLLWKETLVICPCLSWIPLSYVPCFGWTIDFTRPVTAPKWYAFYFCDRMCRLPGLMRNPRDSPHILIKLLTDCFLTAGAKIGEHHQTGNLHIQKTNCLHVQMHSVLQPPKNASRIHLRKRQFQCCCVFVKRNACISEATHFTQKTVLTM